MRGKKELDSFRCCFCQRTAKEIKSFIENRDKSNSRSVSDIFYKVKGGYTSCGRCVSEHDLSLTNNGEAVLQHATYDRNYVYVPEIFDRLQFKEAPITGDEPLRLHELEV